MEEQFEITHTFKFYWRNDSIYCGKICFGEVFYTSLRSREDPKCFEVQINLPNGLGRFFNFKEKRFTTMEEAKQVLEHRIKHWFEQLGIVE